MSNLSPRRYTGPSQMEQERKEEPVRTLFVRGLPGDVKSREVYNLFRPYEGFQSASLSYSGEKLVGRTRRSNVNGRFIYPACCIAACFFCYFFKQFICDGSYE